MLVTQDKYKLKFLSLVGTPKKMMPLKSDMMSQVDLRVDCSWLIWGLIDPRLIWGLIDPRIILYGTFETFENKIHQNSTGCLCSLCKFKTFWLSQKNCNPFVPALTYFKTSSSIGFHLGWNLTIPPENQTTEFFTSDSLIWRISSVAWHFFCEPDWCDWWLINVAQVNIDLYIGILKFLCV